MSISAVLVGDIHGNPAAIHRALEHPVTIIQLGDFGFAAHYSSTLGAISSDRLKVIGGNHDEYPALVAYPHYLGDFGLIPGTESTMFVRGALSIDRQIRTQGIDWWEEEELSVREFDAFLSEYERVRPQLVLSHDSPFADGVATLPVRSRTQQYLREALNIHQPRTWIHGHYHVSKRYEFGSTLIVSLGIDELLLAQLP